MNRPDYERWTELVDREACEELLSEEERQFVQAFAATDAVAREERSLYEEMAEAFAPEDAAANQAVADRAVSMVVARRGALRRVRGQRILVSMGTLAAAAGVVFWAAHRSATHTTVPALASVLELSTGEVRVDGQVVRLGAHIAVGSQVRVAGGVACVAVEPTVHACLADGASLRIGAVAGASHRVELAAGRVAVALDPMRAGERFSVVARGVWSTAVGTAFTVESLLGGGVQTVVHEGKVRVGSELDGEVVPAHKIGLSTAGPLEVKPLVNHAETETAEWKALASVAHRSVEGPMTEVPVPEAPAGEAPSQGSAAIAAAEPAAHGDRAEARGSGEVRKQTASELLAEARQELREQHWQGAATAYREIVARFPGSPEARTVLVPLAGLELDRLGQPGVALGHLDAYLASGGALAMEARLSRIRAYRVLGRASDEARAIDEFLTAHPSSLDAARLRERRAELGAR